MSADRLQSRRECVRRLPAFGRELLALRNHGQRPVDPVMVYLDRWPTHRGPYVAPTLVVPRDMPVQALDWRLVRGLEVHLLSWSGVGLGVAVDVMLRAGVARLTMMNFAAPDSDPWAIDMNACGPADRALADLGGIAA